MKTPLLASGVTQNSRSRSKSAYDAAVSRKPVPESAATAPSMICQFASPTGVQPVRVVPSNSVCHALADAAESVAGSLPPSQAQTLATATRTISFARMYPPASQRLGDACLGQPA